MRNRNRSRQSLLPGARPAGTTATATMRPVESLPVQTGGCHCQRAAGARRAPAGAPRVVLVGSPNVGKSALFNALTGAYATVSNYPGTTVEITRGMGRIGGHELELVDTPGFYSFLPVTEEERVTRRLLATERPDLVLHVVEAAALDRMLPLTLQLLEAGFPVVLVLNMMDECERLGLSVDVQALSDRLGIPVVATVASAGRGLDQLRREVAQLGCGVLEPAV